MPEPTTEHETGQTFSQDKQAEHVVELVATATTAAEVDQSDHTPTVWHIADAEVRTIGELLNAADRELPSETINEIRANDGTVGDLKAELDRHRTNALKAISTTADELRVANYLVLFGGRDLEGVASPTVNADGSKGEYFTADTDLESHYTKSGVVFVDWEHGQEDAPGPGDVLGVVDWKTAKRDERGVWVERVLNRRSKYVQWLEGLITDGIIGSSSEAVPDETEKASDGAILRWPLRRDTLTVQPMEPRMITENHLQAFKALGLPVPDDIAATPEPQQETAPEDAPVDRAASVAVAKAKARCQQFLISLLEE